MWECGKLNEGIESIRLDYAHICGAPSDSYIDVGEYSPLWEVIVPGQEGLGCIRNVD